MTTPTTAPVAPRRTAHAVIGALGVVVGVALLWSILFTAFGTTTGADVGRASRLADDFATAHAAGLGSPNRGSSWQVRTGRWAVAGGVATATPAGGRPSAAVTAHVGPGRVAVAATLPVVASGAGVAVRWRSEADYAYAVARPAQGAWEVGVVRGGTVTVLGSASPAPRAGARLQLRTDERRLELWIDGRFVRAYDTDLPNGDDIALVVEPQAAGVASFDDVTAGPPAAATTLLRPDGSTIVHRSGP